jgi:CheY-like chemotaxis protein
MECLFGGRAPRVMVVDDEEAIRVSMASVLGSRGFEVEVAANAADALAAFETAPADIVVTDVYMPGGDGYDLISRLRNKYRDLPIVVMSGGRADHDTFGAAKRLGADAIVEKPFAASYLVETLRRSLIFEAVRRSAVRLEENCGLPGSAASQ